MKESADIELWVAGRMFHRFHGEILWPAQKYNEQAHNFALIGATTLLNICIAICYSPHDPSHQRLHVTVKWVYQKRIFAAYLIPVYAIEEQ